MPPIDLSCASSHPTDGDERRCLPSCLIESLDTHCGWCDCRACGFCAQRELDALASWRALPSRSSLQGVASFEARALRCPPPRGCAFRLRPTNIAHWARWSLGSARVFTPPLPPPPPHALRLELRLIRPFSAEAAVLEQTLLPELAGALEVDADRLQLTDVRLGAEYVVVTLLPGNVPGSPGNVPGSGGPDAYDLALALHGLVQARAAPLRAGRASRSIDANAGLTLLHPDGSDEPFAPPAEAPVPLDAQLKRGGAALLHGVSSLGHDVAAALRNSSLADQLAAGNASDAATSVASVAMAAAAAHSGGDGAASLAAVAVLVAVAVLCVRACCCRGASSSSSSSSMSRMSKAEDDDETTGFLSRGGSGNGNGGVGGHGGGARAHHGAALPTAQLPSDAHALRLSPDLLRAPTADELRLLGKVAASNGRGQQQDLDPARVEFKF